MDSSVLLKDQIWFLRVCNHVSNELYTWSTSDAMVFAVCLHSDIICSDSWCEAPYSVASFIFEMDLHCHRLLYLVNQFVDWSTIYVGTPHSLWCPLHLIEFARQELRCIRVESLHLYICLSVWLLACLPVWSICFPVVYWLLFVSCHSCQFTASFVKFLCFITLSTSFSPFISLS